MTTKPEAKITERALPPKFKYIIQGDYVLRLTWPERIKVLLGYRIDLRYHAPTEHSPGKMEPTLLHKVVNKL